MKTVLMFSGGLDSTVVRSLLAGDVECVFFDYGQPHAARELEAARTIEPDVKVMALPPMPMAGRVGSASVVPARNLAMVSVAASYALQIGAGRVVSGVNAADHDVYPDCRPAFNSALNRLLFETYGVHYATPLAGKTKREVVNLGRRLGAAIATSWSCYEGNDEPCGACGACTVRAEAGA